MPRRARLHPSCWPILATFTHDDGLGADVRQCPDPKLYAVDWHRHGQWLHTEYFCTRSDARLAAALPPVSVSGAA